MCCNPIIFLILCIHRCGEHHGLFGPMSWPRKQIEFCVALLTGTNGSVQTGCCKRRPWCSEPTGNMVITTRKSELTAYSGSQLVLFYGWWSWCMGPPPPPPHAQNSRSPSTQWWIASIRWTIGKDRRAQDLISTPPFYFLPFFHFGRSQINCIVFFFSVLSLLPFPPSVFHRLQTHSPFVELLMS